MIAYIALLAIHKTVNGRLNIKRKVENIYSHYLFFKQIFVSTFLIDDKVNIISLHISTQMIQYNNILKIDSFSDYIFDKKCSWHL